MRHLILSELHLKTLAAHSQNGNIAWLHKHCVVKKFYVWVLIHSSSFSSTKDYRSDVDLFIFVFFWFNPRICVIVEIERTVCHKIEKLYLRNIIQHWLAKYLFWKVINRIVDLVPLNVSREIDFASKSFKLKRKYTIMTNVDQLLKLFNFTGC